MQRHVLVTLLPALFLFLVPVHAGSKGSVDPKDLADVPLEALDSLKETEHAAFVAIVGQAAAERQETQAKSALQEAERSLNAEKLDLKAAKAEEKAARANNDPERLTAAVALVSAAGNDLASAERFVDWRQEALSAARAVVRAQSAYMELAVAKRELARAEQLVAAGSAAATKYRVSDLKETVNRRQIEYDKLARKARETETQAEQKAQAYETGS